MAPSNTKDCFRECIGKRVIGFLADALPVSRRDLSAGTRTLIFDDGTGLTFATNGSFWRENSRDIEWAIKDRQRDLALIQRDISDVLAVAGATALLGGSMPENDNSNGVQEERQAEQFNEQQQDEKTGDAKNPPSDQGDGATGGESQPEDEKTGQPV